MRLQRCQVTRSCRALSFTLIKREPIEKFEHRNSKIHFIFHNDHSNRGVESRLQVGMGYNRVASSKALMVIQFREDSNC